MFEFFKQKRAVSPVIGVILMVAITVILAAVIGAFVLGLGDDLGNSAGPQASISYDTDIDEGGDVQLTISHNGGDAIPQGAEFAGDITGTNTEDPVILSSDLTAGNSVILAELDHSGTTSGVDNFGGTGSSLTNGGTVNLVVDDTVVATFDIPEESTG